MLAEFVVFDTDDFSIEHISDSSANEKLIAEFTAAKNAAGLERYLKCAASTDEKSNMSRTYLVKDKTTNELAGYFSVRTGLITQEISDEYFDSIPALELSNFAVNQNYRNNHPEVQKLGSYIFLNFVLPLADAVSKYVGVNTLYIYALPEDKLIAHYKTMGFSRLPPKQEKFVQKHIKPKYDAGCIFMYQAL